MALFTRLYDRVMHWARHRHAAWYLGGLSFAESSFFPIPPDVMLAPMSLARPRRAWFYALITTLTSVAGGLLGYAIGHFALEWLTPLIGEGGRWHEHYLHAHAWFAKWGFWAVFLAGFSPIPYKVFTITAGTLAMPLPPFVLASCIGRGMRFFMVAGLLAWGGPRMEAMLRRYVEWLGWLLVVLAVVAYLLLRNS